MQWGCSSSGSVLTALCGMASSSPCMGRSAARIEAPKAKLLALLALFGLLGGHLVSAVHHLTERHERCAEHGELIHANADHDATDLVGEGWSKSTPKQEAEHEHCGLILAVEADRTTVAHVQACSQHVLWHAGWSLTGFDSGVSPLSVAPKNSPPA